MRNGIRPTGAEANGTSTRTPAQGSLRPLAPKHLASKLVSSSANPHSSIVIATAFGPVLLVCSVAVSLHIQVVHHWGVEHLGPAIQPFSTQGSRQDSQLQATPPLRQPQLLVLSDLVWSLDTKAGLPNGHCPS